jgi:hypothetical protein
MGRINIKKTIYLGGMLVLVLCLILLKLFYSIEYIEIENSSSIILKYSYMEIKIEEILYKKDEIKELENIFNRSIYCSDYPACFFDENISLTFINDNERITLYPALDGCNTFKDFDKNKYLSIGDKKRKKLDNILKRYNFILFPGRM